MLDLDAIWGGVTDPAQHDPNQFRYLLYAINPKASAHIRQQRAMFAKQDSEAGRKPPDLSHGDQSIDLLREPERLADRVSLSMSLVDEAHTKTWGDVGLIVEAPLGNLISTSTQDDGTHNDNWDMLLWQKQRSRIVSGDYLLELCGKDTLTEVTALARHEGRELQLKGFFYKTGLDGQPLDRELYHQVRAQSRRLNLPLIAIRARERERDDEIYDQKGNLRVTLDHKTYYLTGAQDTVYTPFMLHDWVRQQRDFMSPEQLELVLDYLRQNGCGEERLAGFETEYAKAQADYHRAYFRFDSEGNVQSLMQHEGYGDSRMDSEVSVEGYARQATIGKIRAALARPQELADHIYATLSREKVEAMVSQAREGLSAEQDAKALAWLDRILPVVEQKSMQLDRRAPIGGNGWFKPAQTISFADLARKMDAQLKADRLRE